ncbi:MAG: amino acid permease [Gammaproteobacteria bacterium]|nr:amino acid permease [Gammaproteobacteria bacterium]MYC52458.1 amino acid permease [Gammaproteobacteria bacterium]
MAKLKRELGLFDVYAIATGATLSSGFFLLPGLAAAQAGGAIPLAYLLAGLLLLPGILSMAELSTAMPRAGGIYYFLDRSMGQRVGAIGGFGTWTTLTLKSAFALVGLGAYLQVYFPDAPAGPIAFAFASGFGAINLFGAKKTSSIQLVLTVVLLAMLGWLIGTGVTAVDPGAFEGAFELGASPFFATVGLVIVSYMGLTHVASVSEEVRNPDRNLALGMLLAFVTVLLVYVLGTWAMVGAIGVEALSADGGNLAPAAAMARAVSGSTGEAVMTVAAILAFTSVGNAGVLSASRYPLAMSRDHVLPAALRRISRWGTPWVAVLATVGLIVLWLLLFDPSSIAKLASAFQLIMFALACLAVIVMRESGLAPYDPGFRAPLYPWVQIIGIVIPFPLIVEMGWLATLLSVAFVAFGLLWYTLYTRDHVRREGAIYHVFERLGQQRNEGLEGELLQILKEKGVRDADPFEQLMASSAVLDYQDAVRFSELVDRASRVLSEQLGLDADSLAQGFFEDSGSGLTPVSQGVVLEHLRLDSIPGHRMVLARVHGGIEIDVGEPDVPPADDEPIQAAFFLASPDPDSGRHLRILAQIAGRVDDESFLTEWLEAEDNLELREVMLRDERMLVVEVLPEGASSALAGITIRDMSLPESTLAAMIRRRGQLVVPHDDTVIEQGDRLTILGSPRDIIDLRHRYDVHATTVPRWWRGRRRSAEVGEVRRGNSR